MSASQTRPDVRLWSGKDAIDRLSAPAFIAQWKKLAHDCPAATAFQGPGFVNAWYASYPEAAPVVAAGFDASGALVGLFTLTVVDGRLTGAGAYQAEYQTWLATPESSAAFVVQAVAAARATYPRLPLRLKYVPAATPIDQLIAA